MAGTRVVLNGAGFKALLQSAAVQADLKSRADRIAAAAGDGMVAERVYLGRNRSRVQVYTDTLEAKRAEANHQALTRAIGAGR